MTPGPPYRATIQHIHVCGIKSKKKQNTQTQTQKNLCTVKWAQCAKTESREL